MPRFSLCFCHWPDAGAITLHGVPQEHQDAGVGGHGSHRFRDAGHGHVARRPFASHGAVWARKVTFVCLDVLREDRAPAEARELVGLLVVAHHVGMLQDQLPPPRRAGLLDTDTDEIGWTQLPARRDLRRLLAPAAVRPLLLRVWPQYPLEAPRQLHRPDVRAPRVPVRVVVLRVGFIGPEFATNEARRGPA